MSTETQPVWGASPDQPPTWSNRTTLAAVGIAAALAVVGGVVVYAATGGGHDDGGHMGGPPGWGGPGGFERTVHGENVVSDGEGGFTTELTQIGDVSAASATSITVRSDDGYSRTYVVDTNTRKPPEAPHNGDRVSVRATEVNGAATATAVMPAQ
ncbi:hypothetical protein BayCH28_03900 [Mycolicibacterium sp. CH28]|uniref:hypothetical protein n=1 Tax=Mycolicibacterium sp. CH28 TaxID=2512237 RepID=UPI0010802560|nr:hypothetical protein [Mycolicibacterium sp. CH28]TGD89749.1 hypothetical protein BayCH28_03900 [Mycolicibacterium sp. CH28]